MPGFKAVPVVIAQTDALEQLLPASVHGVDHTVRLGKGSPVTIKVELRFHISAHRHPRVLRKGRAAQVQNQAQRQANHSYQCLFHNEPPVSILRLMLQGNPDNAIIASNYLRVL